MVNTSRRLLSFFIVLAMTASISLTPLMDDSNVVDAAKKSKAYKVVRIVDGDTIVVKKNGKKIKVRFIGVDCPESVHPDSDKNVEYGKIASKYTKKKLKGKKVKLEYDKDKKDQYGRTLAYVYYGKNYKTMINKSLIKAGHAKAKYYSPNKRYKKTFEKLQKTAKANKKGLWKYGSMPEEVSNDSNTSSDSYVGATTTKKFHFTSCTWAGKINTENRAYFKSRDEAINLGYSPCKVCNP